MVAHAQLQKIHADLESIAKAGHELVAITRSVGVEVTRLARGTGDVTERALAARAAVKDQATDLPAPVGKTSTKDLYAQVEALLESKPHTFRELIDITGETKENRVKGVLVRLQRNRRGCINLGDGRRAVWAILSEAAMQAVTRKARR